MFSVIYIFIYVRKSFRLFAAFHYKRFLWPSLEKFSCKLLASAGRSKFSLSHRFPFSLAMIKVESFHFFYLAYVISKMSPYHPPSCYSVPHPQKALTVNIPKILAQITPEPPGESKHSASSRLGKGARRIRKKTIPSRLYTDSWSLSHITLQSLAQLDLPH